MGIWNFRIEDPPFPEMTVTEILSLPETADKTELYAALLPQVEAVIAGEDDLIANLANVAAMLKSAFDFHWVGFYRTLAPGMLVLGPFQGPLACVRIPFGRGVCGAAAASGQTQLVPDVDAFPGHIACSSLSRSEIVVPLVAAGETRLVLDVDSADLDAFDATDRIALESLVALIRARHFGG
jgi:L-methionine (R)-S-oxide reductase